MAGVSKRICNSMKGLLGKMMIRSSVILIDYNPVIVIVDGQDVEVGKAVWSQPTHSHGLHFWNNEIWVLPVHIDCLKRERERCASLCGDHEAGA
jgi:hypothetical protein